MEERGGTGHVHTVGARRNCSGQAEELGPTKLLRMHAFPISGTACRRRNLQMYTNSQHFCCVDLVGTFRRKLRRKNTPGSPSASLWAELRRGASSADILKSAFVLAIGVPIH